MRQHRSIALSLLLTAVGSWTGPARGADSPAAAALKAKGLTRSGSTFVIEDETPVLARMKEVKGILARYAALAERQALAEQGTAQLNRMEERRIELQSHLEQINQRIIEQASQQGGGFGRPGGGGFPGGGGGSPMIAERNQVQATLTEIAAEQKALKAQTPLAKERSTLDENVKKGEEAYKTALAEIRPMVEAVVKKYADLAADEAVKKVMDELKATSKGKVKIGPSDAFVVASKQLDQAERQFLGKKPPASAAKKKARAKK